MCTLVKTYESVNVVMKSTKEVRTEWKKSYNTLAKLLKETQTKEGFKVAKTWFESMGLPTDRKVSKTDIESMIKFYHTDKKGVQYPAIVVRKAIKDADGNEKKDAEGNVMYDYKTRPVKNGMWTLDVLTKVLASNK